MSTRSPRAVLRSSSIPLIALAVTVAAAGCGGGGGGTPPSDGGADNRVDGMGAAGAGGSGGSTATTGAGGGAGGATGNDGGAGAGGARSDGGQDAGGSNGGGGGGSDGGAGTGGDAGGSICPAGQACTLANDDNGICGGSGSCGGCATDGQCQSAYGASNICEGSVCIAGNCHANADCASGGLICDTPTHTCVACSGDAACVTAYGAGHICVGSVCISGDCRATSDCSGGQLCDLSTHSCGACPGDAACVSELGANHLCEGNVCISGQCRTAQSCSNGQICNSGTFACASCSTNAQCVSAYGTNHLCLGSACVSGNCQTTADCGGGQVCNTGALICVACSGDSQCLADYGPAHICNSGQCVSGDCHTSSDCTGGKVCNTSSNMCVACSGDAACKGDSAYGSATICLGGACTQGDCHDTSNDCASGQICGLASAHTCGACSTDGQCTGDPRYGGSDICYQGSCGFGNCHATSQDCAGPNAGYICGVAVTNVCGACTADGQCTADPQYGSGTICATAQTASFGKCVSAACTTNNAACTDNTGDFCCGNTCMAGNCCNDNDCAANPNFGMGFACSSHNCTQCNPVTGNRYLVDPVNGSDASGNGSGMSGAMTAPGCAFKTIARALQVMPATPAAGTKLVLVGPATLVLGAAVTLPPNVTLTTTGGPVTVTLFVTGAGNPGGFRLLNNGSGVSGDPAAPLTLDGSSHTSGIGIQVAAGMATYTSSVSNVTIQNTGGDGIRVTAGTLTIGGGVVVTSANQDGLRVSGGAAVVNNPSGAQTLFTGNTQYGVEVSGLGSVSIAGTVGAPVPSNNGTVVLSYNGNAGLRVAQTVGGTLALNDINGVVSWANTNRGMIVLGGSRFKLRNSVLGSGPEGIRIANNGNSAAGNDLTNIDLGTAADFGHNYIQMPNGALGFHTGAGICVAMSGNMGTLTLQAAGNFMITAGNPGTQVDCATAAATVSKGTNCGANTRSSVGIATNASTTIVNVLDMCN